MDLAKYKLSLKKLLISADTDDILNELFNTVDDDSDLFNQVILLLRQYNDLAKKQRTGTIRPDDYNHRLTVIHNGILSLIDDLEEDSLITDKTTVSNRTEGQNRAAKKAIPNSVFLSTPMSTFTTVNGFKDMKALSQRIQEVLRYDLDYNIIYYAGNTIDDLNDFHTPEASIVQDFKAIDTCETFILVYPEKMPTSSLVEIGYGMALGKATIIFVPKRDELPFLLTKADHAFPNIRIFEVDDLGKIPELLPKVMKG